MEDGCGDKATHIASTQSSSESVPEKKTAMQYAGELQTKSSKHVWNKFCMNAKVNLEVLLLLVVIIIVALVVVVMFLAHV